MIKIQLIELVKRRLTGDNFAIHDRIIDHNISLAFNTFYFKLYNKNISFDGHVKTFEDVPVKFESSSMSYYSDLPAMIINIPDIAAGVRRVFYKKKNSVRFVPVAHDAAPVFSELEVDQFSDSIGYVFTNGRIEYSTMDPTITSVSMDVIRPFEYYDDDEDVWIPAGADEQLIETIVRFITGMPAQKLSNDNANTN